jgi:hypothetical protein
VLYDCVSLGQLLFCGLDLLVHVLQNLLKALERVVLALEVELVHEKSVLISGLGVDAHGFLADLYVPSSHLASV